jgi:hypothetical protein
MRKTLYGEKAGMRMVFIVECRAQVEISNAESRCCWDWFVGDK